MTSKKSGGVPPSRKSHFDRDTQLETHLQEDMNKWRRWRRQRPRVKGEADQRGRRESDSFIEVMWVSPRCQASSGATRGCGRGYATLRPVNLHRVFNPKPSLHSGLSAWVTVKPLENFYCWTALLLWPPGSALSCRGHRCLLESWRGCIHSKF